MKLNYLIFVLMAFFSLTSSAKAHHTGTLSSINLGARYSSILEKRGVVLYRDFQIDPVAGIFFFDDRLEFLGDSIGYHDFIYEDKIRLRGRLASVSDKPLFPAYDSIQNGSPSRPDTYEGSLSGEFFFPGYNDQYLAELDITYAKDLSQHHGNYLELQGKVKLFSVYSETLKMPLEPNFVATVGTADRSHNQYFYGPDDEALGVNNISYGFWIAFPTEADRAFPIVQFTRFSTVGDHRKARYADGRNEGFLISFIATYGFLD